MNYDKLPRTRKAKTLFTAGMLALALSGEAGEKAPSKTEQTPLADPVCVVEENAHLLSDTGLENQTIYNPQKLQQAHPMLSKKLDAYCGVVERDADLRALEPIADPQLALEADMVNGELNRAYADVLEQANRDYGLGADQRAIKQLRKSE